MALCATLDLIISKTNLINQVNIAPCDWSDHHLISFTIINAVLKWIGQPLKLKRWRRDFRAVKPNDRAPPHEVTEVADLTDFHNNAMTNIADSVAPLRLKRLPNKDGKPWFNRDLNEERRNLRLAERNWRLAPSSTYLQVLRAHRRTDQNQMKDAKLSFFREQLDNASNRPRKLF